ncbi:MAG TPA: YbdD/YjiX family protein [Gemmatimonadales bacterium]|nr:YbdD/YjiX family protein [Gemmatimonadales bacterium]
MLGDLRGSALKDFLAPYWRSVVPRRLGRLVRGLQRVCGMPDYESYLQHLRTTHPEWPLPTEREYFELYVKSRYEDGPTRCC